ncbi:MAG: hypothetical protein N3D85_00730 [Candidatus Bathyarchaeota archaeon]|nr:hypothetical protein [Candidatus Bathyarchaeota archaeon]
MVKTSITRRFLVLVTAILIVETLSSANANVYTFFVAQAAVSVENPRVVLQSGTAGSGIIYDHGTGAFVNVAPLPTPYYYPNSYNIVAGSYISGTLPSSVQSVDASYFITRSAGSATSTQTYYPSSYSLQGSTTLVSGSLVDLQSNNGAYMTFRSYSTVSSNEEDFVDQTSNVDGSADIGTHSSFAAMKTGPDSVYDTLTEADAGSYATITYVGAGAMAAGTINVSPALPTGWQQNDIFLLFCETANQPVAAPSGWAEVSNSPQGTGTAGGNAATRLTVFWRRATASENAPTVTNPGNHIVAGILAFRGVVESGNPWDVTAGNVQPTASTSVSIPGATTSVPGCMVVVAVATGADTNTAQCSNWANSNLQGLTERVDYYSNAGNGGGFGVATGTQQSAGNYGTTTATVATSFAQGIISIALKPKWIPNYRLDLEVQWTNATYNWHNKVLCIYAGTLASETLLVDVWSGSSWVNLIPAVAAGWNNVSISSYLTSSTLTIRFRDGTTTGDTTQNSWQIDCALIYKWNTLYTAEVEFTGTSNTWSWSQLSWTVDSSLTESSVDVTIQLYDYQANQYATSGQGYLAYTSSSTPNTDETKTQTITTNAEYYRDGAGNWKLKIKCQKITATQFDFKADWIKFEPTHYTQYTTTTEFTFTGVTTEPPAQLNFTIVSQYDLATVDVTIQVWNYTSSSYATSGQGYLAYTSSPTVNTDETKQLTIAINAESNVNSGQAKIKITAVKNTTTQFQQKINQIQLCFHTFKYDYVLRAANQVSDSWKIRLTAYDQASIARLTNCTIYLYDASNEPSAQIVVTNGVYNQQYGNWVDLTALSNLKIAMVVSTSTAGASQIYAYLEVRIPNTTTYNLLPITFQIS